MQTFKKKKKQKALVFFFKLCFIFICFLSDSFLFLVQRQSALFKLVCTFIGELSQKIELFRLKWYLLKEHTHRAADRNSGTCGLQKQFTRFQSQKSENDQPVIVGYHTVLLNPGKKLYHQSFCLGFPYVCNFVEPILLDGTLKQLIF